MVGIKLNYLCLCVCVCVASAQDLSKGHERYFPTDSECVFIAYACTGNIHLAHMHVHTHMHTHAHTHTCT